jgi:hypothetical protein
MGRSDRSDFKLKLVADATEIELTGFNQALGKIIPVINNSGITAAINFDKSGAMNYEAVIPFSTFYKNELIPSDSTVIFAYQIKVNPVARVKDSANNGESNRGGGMGGMRGGGGGMGGGGMHGGGMHGGGMRGGGGMNRSGGNGDQRNANNSGTTKTVIRLKLSYK